MAAFRTQLMFDAPFVGGFNQSGQFLDGDALWDVHLPSPLFEGQDLGGRSTR